MCTIGKLTSNGSFACGHKQRFGALYSQATVRLLVVSGSILILIACEYRAPNFDHATATAVPAYHECRGLAAADAATCRTFTGKTTCEAGGLCEWVNKYQELLSTGWRYSTCDREGNGRPNKLCTALCENQMFCGGLGLDPYAECQVCKQTDRPQPSLYCIRLLTLVAVAVCVRATD